MSEYMAPDIVERIVSVMERRPIDTDVPSFRRMSEEQQVKEIRHIALVDPLLVWDSFVESVVPRKFIAAWRAGDAIEMQRLVSEALRDSPELEDEINRFYTESDND